MFLIVLSRLPLRAAAFPASTGMDTFSSMRMVGALLGHAYYTHMSSPAGYKPWPQVQAIITLFEN